MGNIAIGSNALKNTVSSENIAIGNSAAAANSTGSNVLAIGANALVTNQATFTQMAIGNNALQQLNNGQENIAIGYNSGNSLTQASSNVLLGHYALSSATNSSNNTIVGHNAALAYTATGNNNNTFIGYQSAFSQTAGNSNTFIGTSVDVSGTTSVNNNTGLGQSVVITASNQVRVGNSAINSIGGQVGWTTFSDARIKSNIQADLHGLDFILQLRPVTYNYNTALLQKLLGITFSEFGRRIKSNSSGATNHGYAAPMFIFGTQATGGIIGTNPVLPAVAATQDNIAMQTDFRSIYYSIMKRWLCRIVPACNR